MAAGDPGIQPLTDEERLAWLRLTRSENVGPVTFRRLLGRFGTAGRALEQLPDLSRRGGSNRTLRVCSAEAATREMEAADELGYRFICLCEPQYPAALRASDGAPPVLAVRGSDKALARSCVAIVGSRNASAVGGRIARTLSADIGRSGYGIVSGLARGIDAAAHEAALETGTIAVMAGGLDRPYPPQNVPLLDEICTNGKGAAVSEMPLGWEPRARDFPRRNRIIAGLALGLVVVEAAKKSGSLISARLAGEMGRLVFAVPGSPLDPRARGTNDLIKDGAILTTDAEDVLAALAPMDGNMPRSGSERFALEEEQIATVAQDGPTTEDRSRVTEALGPAPVAIDDIVRHTGLPPAGIYVVLLELDLAGRLARHPGGLVSLLPGSAH
ncbi:DNA-processing protein DprA [Nitratireductor sp. XY-223]|uniref:DNA-processing protein DprA n=1 Tax=Nitratireductor sp. XY-223 TaxID=2561926 RepID=UPI0010AB1B98|nr:DNA-processing protein DprA [Nitratireductor sp. XY-223]